MFPLFLNAINTKVIIKNNDVLVWYARIVRKINIAVYMFFLLRLDVYIQDASVAHNIENASTIASANTNVSNVQKLNIILNVIPAINNCFFLFSPILSLTIVFCKLPITKKKMAVCSSLGSYEHIHTKWFLNKNFY